MRALRRQSYIAPSERGTRARSYVAPSERPVPVPPRPSRAELDRRSRASYVASSERNDFASSIPDADVEVTSFREPAPRKSHVAKAGVGRRRLLELGDRRAEGRRRPSTTTSSGSYLFDDISEEQRASLPTPPHKTTHPAFPPPPHPSSFLPPPAPRQPSYMETQPSGFAAWPLPMHRSPRRRRRARRRSRRSCRSNT